MWSDRPAGFTLIEAVVVVGILSVVFTSLFMLLSFGMRGYHQARQRSGITSDMTRVRAHLEHDFNLTTFASFSMVERNYEVASGAVNRDACAILGRSDWKAADALGATSRLPRWNRYLVYTTPTGQDEKLVRLEVEPASLLPLPEPGWDVAPYFGLTAVMEDIPSGDVRRTQGLSHNLFEFRCEPDGLARSIWITVKLRERGAGAGLGAKQVDESLEAVFCFQPRNNGPEMAK